MHGKEKIGGLPRWPVASVACVLLVIGWIVGAVLLGDYVRPLHWGRAGSILPHRRLRLGIPRALADAVGSV